MYGKRIPSLVLSIVLALNVCAFTGCSDDTVKVIKQKISDIQIYSDSAIGFVTDLEDQGVLPKDKADNALLALREIKNGTEAFTAQAQGVTKFDPGSKSDWLNLFKRVSTGIKNFKEKAGPDLIAILRALNVQDPEKWVTWINGAIRILEAASRIIESRLSN